MTVVFHHLSILILCLFGFYVRAGTERYIIYPQEDLSLDERQQFTEKLIELAGAQGNVYTSYRRRLKEIRFWCADLDITAYEKLSKDIQVRATEYVYDVTNKSVRYSAFKWTRWLSSPSLMNHRTKTVPTYSDQLVK